MTTEHNDSPTALITGGASGIGRATAHALARQGFSIVLGDIDEERGRTTAAELEAEGFPAMFLRLDVTDPDSVERAVDTAGSTYGPLTVVCNNAGGGVYSSVADLAPVDYDRIIKLNQYGVYYGLHFASRHMRDRGIEGTIVNTCSASGNLATPMLFAYNTAKAAVTMMTTSAAHDLADLNIRVVGVAPGVTETPITQKYKDQGEDVEKSYLSKHMRQRWIAAEEVASVIGFLCSDGAQAINGTVVEVDDGYTRFK